MLVSSTNGKYMTAKHILYVEDNAEIRANVVEILEIEGYQVFEAENGFNGIIAASDKSFDLILVDLMLPDMYGLELVSRLKAMPRLENIPIIALTARVIDSQGKPIVVELFDALLFKPFSADELVELVHRFIG
jgi:CheY-like chemotaxis protein